MVMKKRIAIVAVCVVAAAAVVVGVLHLTDGKKAGLPVVGAVIPVAQRPKAPPISGSTLTGGHLNVASLRGATVVLNFWGSWCGPCQAEAPVLARVADDTHRLGVRFVGVDIRDDPAAGLAFEQQHGISYPSISDPNDLIAAAFGPIAPASTPATYILDGRGRIAWAYFARVSYGQLESAVLAVAR
jgi:thiol-disulfide isomerase/thioredoxin